MKALIGMLLLACLGVPPGNSQVIRAADPKSTIIALERVGKMQASELQDLKTLNIILDNSFVSVDREGTLMNKAEVLAYVQSVDALRFATEAMFVNVHGDTAIVTGLYRIRGVERGKPFLRRERFVDTWFYKKGQWIAIASLSTPAEN